MSQVAICLGSAHLSFLQGIPDLCFHTEGRPGDEAQSLGAYVNDLCDIQSIPQMNGFALIYHLSLSFVAVNRRRLVSFEIAARTPSSTCKQKN